MEITNETKCKVFAQYLGQRVELDNGGSKVRNRILCAVGGIDDGGHEYVKLKMGTFAHAVFIKENNAKLILKSLSEISDEDIDMVAKMQGFIIRNDFSICFENERFKWDDGNTWGEFTHASLYHQTADYLRSKGYDVPHFLLEYKTLQQSGLAIYEK